MSTRDWLLADSPTSRWQANAGRAYRVFTALLRNPLSVLGGVIILVLLLSFSSVISKLTRENKLLAQEIARLNSERGEPGSVPGQASPERQESPIPK